MKNTKTSSTGPDPGSIDRVLVHLAATPAPDGAIKAHIQYIAKIDEVLAFMPGRDRAIMDKIGAKFRLAISPVGLDIYARNLYRSGPPVDFAGMIVAGNHFTMNGLSPYLDTTCLVLLKPDSENRYQVLPRELLYKTASRYLTPLSESLHRQRRKNAAILSSADRP
jgi:hypothetical protein